MLHSADPDTSDEDIVYQIVSPFPANGQLLVDGAPVTPTNNTFTQADINAGKISYQQTGAAITESFSFIVSDGDPGTNDTDVHEFVVTSNFVNNAPVLSPGDFSLSTINEDDVTNNGNSVTEILNSGNADLITDGNANAIEGIAVIAADNSNGEFQFRTCLLYTSPSPRDKRQSRMPSSA